MLANEIEALFGWLVAGQEYYIIIFSNQWIINEVLIDTLLFLLCKARSTYNYYFNRYID